MRLRPLAIALLFATASLSGQRDTVELTNGKTHSGVLSGRVAAFVALRIKDGPGEIELRFAPDEIARIQFSDSPTQERPQSLSTLERLVRVRLPYIELLEPTDESLFPRLVESLIDSNRPQDALDRAKLWRTKLRSPAQISKIEELQIVASWNLGSLEESAFYSKRWIDAGKTARETALPWVVLAEMALLEERDEDALWLSLNPIEFSYPDAPRFLDRAYEVAITSAHQLGRSRLSRQLYADMRDRNLHWPIESKRSHIVAEISSMNDANADTPESPIASSESNSRSVNRITGSP